MHDFNKAGPLADRFRPRTREEFVGQDHLLGEGKILRRLIESDQLPSMILWGPPGTGKTTLAYIIAKKTQAYFASFSAVLSGVKDLRELIEEAKKQQLKARRTILFVDEIHRFNKAQQDAFLPHIEKGSIILIGATTENPSFEIIPPLLSRTRVFKLNPLTAKELILILQRALQDTERGLGDLELQIESGVLEYIAQISDGDARAALNALELAASILVGQDNGNKVITLETLQDALQRKALLYDKSGEEHYNVISALHKSLRGSDPDAALYWLGRMLEAGEDPLYIARRLIRFASEDVGNADPQSLTIAVSAMQAFHFIGLPEGKLALAQATVYLACAPKSNALYEAYNKVEKDIRNTPSFPVPLHLRNAPTYLMKSLGYSQGYKYPHHYSNSFVEEEYLPQPLSGKVYYRPKGLGFEGEIKRRLEGWWPKKRKKLKN
jgi:putative ATPase